MRDYVTAIDLKIQTACCLLHTSNLRLSQSLPLSLSPTPPLPTPFFQPMFRPKSSVQKKSVLSLRVVLTVPNALLISTLLCLTGWLSFQTGRQTMNDLVAQLLPEATSRIWDRLDNYLKEGVLDNYLKEGILDNYLKEGVGVGKKEKNYNRIPTGSVNPLSPSQTAGVTIKPNGKRNGSDSPKTIFQNG